MVQAKGPKGSLVHSAGCTLDVLQLGGANHRIRNGVPPKGRAVGERNSPSREWDIIKSHGLIPLKRIAAKHTLDIGMNRRSHFARWSLIIFDIWDLGNEVSEPVAP